MISQVGTGEACSLNNSPLRSNLNEPGGFNQGKPFTAHLSGKWHAGIRRVLLNFEVNFTDRRVPHVIDCLDFDEIGSPFLKRKRLAILKIF